MRLNLGLMGGQARARTFGSKYGVAISTLTTSRKCYAKLPGLQMLDALIMLEDLEMHDSLLPTTTITVVEGEGTLTDVEYSLDGGAWTDAAGVWGTSKYIQVRGVSSADYETALSANIAIGAYNYLFYVTTMIAPGDGDPIEFDGESVTFDGDPAVTW